MGLGEYIWPREGNACWVAPTASALLAQSAPPPLLTPGEVSTRDQLSPAAPPTASGKLDSSAVWPMPLMLPGSGHGVPQALDAPRDRVAAGHEVGRGMSSATWALAAFTRLVVAFISCRSSGKTTNDIPKRLPAPHPTGCLSGCENRPKLLTCDACKLE